VEEVTRVYPASQPKPMVKVFVDFKQYGQMVAWISELLPEHMAQVVD